MRFEDVAAAVAGVPYMSPAQGRMIFDHLCAQRPSAVLELGTARGVGAAYMAAALEANDHGELESVESSGVRFEDPGPEDVLARAGLSHRVRLDRSFSTYTWFLKEKIQERADSSANCEPCYDFVYLDGAKNWTVDGCAIFLIEKLLRPGGWLLMDDLGWSYGAAGKAVADGVRVAEMSPRERAEPHLQAVFDLLVTQHPSFTELRVQDGKWGWARKAPGEPRKLSIETTRSLSALALAGVHRVQRRRRTRP